MLSCLFTATFDDRNESLPPHLLSILDFLGRVVFLYTTTANTMQGGNRGWKPWVEPKESHDHSRVAAQQPIDSLELY